jgi:soluble lytic murein transglycosylase-like protein
VIFALYLCAHLDRCTPAALRRSWELAPVLASEAHAAGVPVELVARIAAHESSYRQDARGARGEVGVMQINPVGRAVQWCRGELGALADLRANVRCGVRLLRVALDRCGGDWGKAATQYNGGACVGSRYGRRVTG